MRGRMEPAQTLRPNGLGEAPQAPTDADAAQRLELARAFAFHLLKGIKQIGIYRHNEGRYPEYLAPAHKALTAWLDTHGPLVVRVEQQNLMLGEGALFSEDTTVAYRFHRDGVRRLIFRPGFTPNELVSFTLIAVSDGDRGEDLLAQLWRAGLEHLETVAVEGFQVDDVSEDQVQVEVDDIVGFLQGRLQGQTGDVFRFARLSADDLDVSLEGVEQLRGAVVRGQPAAPALKAKLQKEISDEENRFFPKLEEVLFQLLAAAPAEAPQYTELFTQVVDALLLQEDFTGLAQIGARLRALEQQVPGEEGPAALRTALCSRMCEDQRVVRVAEILRSRKPAQPKEVLAYLQGLDARAAPVLLSQLETVEVPESRQLLIDALAPWAKVDPQPFIERLGADSAQTVRDMVELLERMQHPDRVKHFAQVLQHKNLAVRLQVLGVLAHTRSGESRRLVVQALSDPMPQVRMTAARLLPELDQQRAFVDLTALVKDPAFEKKPAEEKVAIWSAIGSTGVADAFSLIRDRMQVKGNLLNRKRVLDDKLLAIAGLEGACSIQGFRMLKEIVEDKSQPLEVLTAARKAMYTTRKALFGDAPAEPGTAGGAGGGTAGGSSGG